MSYLAISGGGSGGAFAAGVLAGWTHRGDRPSFDIVSGVSTGALIAPMAFLGAGYDDQLRFAYTSGITDGLVKPKFPISGLFGSGVLEQEPLRALVERFATADLVREVAKEHRLGRRLLVLTTNLDAQRPVLWDMGRIASMGNEVGLRLFREVLLASASIPAVFPPVLVHVSSGDKAFEELHVDGGVINQIFTFPDAAFAEADEGQVSGSTRAHIYLLINNALIPEFSVTQNSTISVASRSLSTMMKAQARSSAFAAYGFARKHGLGFSIASIDQQIPYEPGDPFNVGYMRKTYLLGYAQASTGSAWRSRPDFHVSQFGESPRAAEK